MATQKMTYVEALSYVLSNCELPEDVREKIDACKASYLKRNASKGERKPSKKQVENEALKVEILDFLHEDPNLLRQAKDVGAHFGKSSQWASALLRQMVEAGTVEKVVEKRVSYFKAVDVDGPQYLEREVEA